MRTSDREIEYPLVYIGRVALSPEDYTEVDVRLHMQVCLCRASRPYKVKSTITGDTTPTVNGQGYTTMSYAIRVAVHWTKYDYYAVESDILQQ